VDEARLVLCGTAVSPAISNSCFVLGKDEVHCQSCTPQWDCPARDGSFQFARPYFASPLSHDNLDCWKSPPFDLPLVLWQDWFLFSTSNNTTPPSQITRTPSTTPDPKNLPFSPPAFRLPLHILPPTIYLKVKLSREVNCILASSS